MTIWFMTTNQGKVEEAREYFSHYGIPVKQFEFEASEPQADDLEIVALSKLSKRFRIFQTQMICYWWKMRDYSLKH